jgi:hypothetical protein
MWKPDIWIQKPFGFRTYLCLVFEWSISILFRSSFWMIHWPIPFHTQKVIKIFFLHKKLQTFDLWTSFGTYFWCSDVRFQLKWDHLNTGPDSIRMATVLYNSSQLAHVWRIGMQQFGQWPKFLLLLKWDFKWFYNLFCKSGHIFTFCTHFSWTALDFKLLSEVMAVYVFHKSGLWMKFPFFGTTPMQN